MTIELNRSYTTEWSLVKINPKTWEGYSPLQKVKTFKFSASADGDAPLIQSGSFTVDLPEGEDSMSPGWYRMTSRIVAPDGSVYAFPLATLVFESGDFSYDYSTWTVTMQGKSVLKPVQDRSMRAGEYIPKGMDGAEWCREIISRCTPAPVVIDSGKFTLSRYYAFDQGTSCLSAVWKLLDAAKWVIRISGDGTVHLRKKEKTPSTRFQGSVLSTFKPTIARNMDLSDVKNYYVVSYNGKTVKAINDDPDSEVSTIARGYVNDEFDTDPVLLAGESLEHYARRMLETSSTVAREYSYTREIWGDVAPFDLVYVNVPNVFTGNARVISQSYTCGSEGGISIDEVIGEEVSLWKAE